MDIEQEMIRYDRVRHINVHISKITYISEHMHGSFELSYVLEGSAQYCQGAYRQTVVPGSLVLTNPYEQHSFAALGDQPLVLLTLQVHKLFIRRYVETIPRLRFATMSLGKLPKEKYDQLVDLLLRTAWAYLGDEGVKQFDVIANATAILGKLYDWLEWELEENPDTSGKELQKNRVQRLISYIDENYRQKITLSMLAQKENISTTYLSHFFRKYFGMTFQEYLKNQRLEKALVLLQDPNISMVDICMNCGFSDRRYLEDACRKTFGCSVSEYRKRCQEQSESTPHPKGEGLHHRCSQRESTQILRKYVTPNQMNTAQEEDYET